MILPGFVTIQYVLHKLFFHGLLNLIVFILMHRYVNKIINKELVEFEHALNIRA